MEYNDQADLLRRIPALLRDGVQYVTTTVRRIRAVAELAAPEVKGRSSSTTCPRISSSSWAASSA